MKLVRQFGSKLPQSIDRVKRSALSAVYSVRNSPKIRGSILHTCPICGNTEATLLKYKKFKTPGQVLPQHVKYECIDCGHVSADWFPPASQIGELYEECYPSSTKSENFRINAEIEIVDRISQRLGDDRRVLDFSCGDNYPILDGDLDVDLFASDVRPGYPYDGKHFFKFDPNMEPKRDFQAIFSVDAIEHISELEATWEYFNKALTEDGLMAHSFPLATDYPRGHLFYRIPFHFCLFSEDSLDRWATKMGFSYLGSEELPNSDVEKVHWFKKERDLP